MLNVDTACRCPPPPPSPVPLYSPDCAPCAGDRISVAPRSCRCRRIARRAVARAWRPERCTPRSDLHPPCRVTPVSVCPWGSTAVSRGQHGSTPVNQGQYRSTPVDTGQNRSVWVSVGQHGSTPVIIIIIAEMAGFSRGWLPHRGKAQMACNYCFPTGTIFQINSEFWKKGTFRWENRTSRLVGPKTHPTIVPRSGIELTTSRLHSFIIAKVTHALNHSAMEVVNAGQYGSTPVNSCQHQSIPVNINQCWSTVNTGQNW